MPNRPKLNCGTRFVSTRASSIATKLPLGNAKFAPAGRMGASPFLSRGAGPFQESRRDSGSKPKVVPTHRDYFGVAFIKVHQPQRGCGTWLLTAEHLSGQERKFGDVCGEDFSAPARRERRAYPTRICKERVTQPGPKRTAARRVAPNLAWGFVARRSQPHCRGMLPPRASPPAKLGATNVTEFTLMTTKSHNPVGVVLLLDLLTQGSPDGSGLPWAGRRNPFGIEQNGCAKNEMRPADSLVRANLIGSQERANKAVRAPIFQGPSVQSTVF